MASPRISVLMSVFNGEKYLTEAIQSILEQSFSDFEFIIVDDGSTDSSREIINSFNDSRIKPIINGENIGLTKSLLKGYEYCHGEFIARMDADDISLPDRFKKQIEYFDKHPEVGVLGTNAYAIGNNSKLKYKINYPENHSFINWSLLFSNPICHPSVMIRKIVIEKFGFYNDEFQRSQDYDYWIRLISNVKFYNIQKPLILLRISGQKVSITQFKDQLKSAIFICQNHLSEFIEYNIDYKIIKGLWTWRFDTIAEAKVMIDTIIKSFNKLSSLNKLSESELSQISKDAARRFLLIAINKIYSPTMLKYFFISMKYDLFSIIRTLLWGLKAVINKYFR
ncbi:MAG: glycosyltransferase [Ignavibacteriae bacterium]|nr:glycosyltransferase [Ignavibacteriota bacterium]